MHSNCLQHEDYHARQITGPFQTLGLAEQLQELLQSDLWSILPYGEASLSQGHLPPKDMQTATIGWGATVPHRQMTNAGLGAVPSGASPSSPKEFKLPKEIGGGKRKKEEQDLKKVSLACH